MHAPTLPSHPSRRGKLFLGVLCLATALGLYWATRPERGSAWFIVAPEVLRYEQQSITNPITGQPYTMAFVEITFTNPTSQSIWYIQNPRYQLNPFALRQPEPAVQFRQKRPWRAWWREKVSNFPNNLKPPWGIWTEPMPALSYHLTNQTMRDFVHELRPGESRKLILGTTIGRPMRWGIVCSEKPPAAGTNGWKTYWSADINSPPPK